MIGQYKNSCPIVRLGHDLSWAVTLARADQRACSPMHRRANIDLYGGPAISSVLFAEIDPALPLRAAVAICL